MTESKHRSSSLGMVLMSFVFMSSGNQWHFQNQYHDHSISFCPIHFLLNGNLSHAWSLDYLL
jgi:hypothetical protein